MVDWGGDHDQLITALVECGWIDLCSEHRLLVHDWPEHAPKYVKGNVERHFGGFASRKEAPLGTLPKEAPSEATKGQSPVDTPTKPSLTKPSQSKHIDQFEEFWRVFPAGRKVKKPQALKAWLKAIKKAKPQALIEAATEYAASPQGNGEYVCMPSTWLNNDRWQDDRAAWARSVPEGKLSIPSEQQTRDSIETRGSRKPPPPRNLALLEAAGANQ